MGFEFEWQKRSNTLKQSKNLWKFVMFEKIDCIYGNNFEIQQNNSSLVFL
jgi:hypothetical protein